MTLSPSNLDLLRCEVEELNRSLFELLKKRSSVVKKISDEKLKNTSSDFYPLWNPERERLIFFRQAAFLKRLKLLELLSFSFFMEVHAQQLSASYYPAWSQKAHLDESSNSLWEQMNPLLVKLIAPNEFKNFKIALEFKTHLLA